MTPPSRSPPSPTTPTSTQPTQPELTDKSVRDTEEPLVEDETPAQTDNSDEQQDGVGGHPARVKHDEDAPPVGDPDARPVRKRKPNMRYPATELDLNSVRTSSRRTPRWAK